MYLYYSANEQASNLINFTKVIYYHGMKIPPCSFIRACLFINIQELGHPACLLEPACLLGTPEYIEILFRYRSLQCRVKFNYIRGFLDIHLWCQAQC